MWISPCSFPRRSVPSQKHTPNLPGNQIQHVIGAIWATILKSAVDLGEGERRERGGRGYCRFPDVAFGLVE